MHIPDGFVDAPTSAVAGVVAAGSVAVAARRCGEQLGERQVPLAAAPAAFVVPAQMLSFPDPTVAVAARRCGEQLGERQVPLAAVTAAFIFAAQMLNFPVAAGTSGHLLGGVLAAVLVGPWAGVVCITVVLAVQALLFADGGLTALGLNVVNLAVVGCLGGWLVYRALRAVLPDRAAGVELAAGLAAFASVPLAAAAFVLEFA